MKSIHECVHEHFQEVFAFVLELKPFQCIQIHGICWNVKYSYSNTQFLYALHPWNGRPKPVSESFEKLQQPLTGNGEESWDSLVCGDLSGWERTGNENNKWVTCGLALWEGGKHHYQNPTRARSQACWRVCVHPPSSWVDESGVQDTASESIFSVVCWILSNVLAFINNTVAELEFFYWFIMVCVAACVHSLYHLLWQHLYSVNLTLWPAF